MGQEEQRCRAGERQRVDERRHRQVASSQKWRRLLQEADDVASHRLLLVSCVRIVL